MSGTNIARVILSAIFLLTISIPWITASNGDRSQHFINCARKCLLMNCTNHNEFRAESTSHQSMINKLMRWNCRDECDYECMWRTTKAFMNRRWVVPQFYGKWPFVRILGLQEPASVVFSVMNLVVHIFMLRKFRRRVRRDSPMYWVWHVFAAICLNAWCWSTVFHSRDWPITELLDYVFAYSMVLATLCCMLIRMCHKRSIWIRAFIALSSIYGFCVHFWYLSNGPFDYRYNMKANILTGVVSGFGWIVWSVRHLHKFPYVKKMCIFQAMVAAGLVLELNDFAPIFWLFDAHSLWHLATIPPTIMFYSFIIDDCHRLREGLHDSHEDDKEKLF